jgi:small lipoprotein (TIGR04454 family)
MKKILPILLLTLIQFTFVNCNKEAVSAAECEPVISKMFENLTKSLKPEEQDKIKAMEATLKAGVVKECTTGKYDLTCMAAATSITALQTCKK